MLLNPLNLLNLICANLCKSVDGLWIPDKPHSVRLSGMTILGLSGEDME